MKRSIFDFLFKATLNHPWLADKSDELYHLLNTDCKTPEEQDLIQDIIEKFTYIDTQRYRQLIASLTTEITSDMTLKDENTQIVAMSGDSNADSAQAVLHSLKPQLQTKFWEKHILVNRFDKVPEILKSNKNHTNIILIDDFLGSGQTVLGRVRTIKKRLEDKKIDNYKIQVKVLVSTEFGLQAVRDSGTEASAQCTIKKAIDDFHPAHEAEHKRELMRAIEKNLSQEHNGKQLPSLGYGGAQAAYYRQDANTPNNVFPVFWWPYNAERRARPVLLTRAMADA